MKSLYFCFLFGGMIFGCSSQPESPSQNSAPAETNISLPQHLQHLENVTAISPEEFSSNITIQLDLVFTETEDVFFGYAGHIAVDHLGRLFIDTGSEMGQKQIYAFGANGQFMNQIGRYGRGPGEFERIQDIQASKDNLYVYENYEVHVFNLSDLSFSHTFVIEMQSLTDDSPIRGLRPGSSFFVQNDSSFLFSFEPHLRKRITVGDHFIYHNFVKSDGTIDSDPILKQRDFTFYNQSPDGSLPRPIPFPMPYIPSSLTAISNDGRIFSTWNEDFLITAYDFSGNYLESIYMPLQAAPLPKEHAVNLAVSKERKNYLEGTETPDNWPVVHRMHVDDENRLCTKKIKKRDSTFKWYVFDENLNPLVTFTLKGERERRPVWHPRDMIIKDNHLYQIQPNTYRYAAEVHRYKIDF